MNFKFRSTPLVMFSGFCLSMFSNGKQEFRYGYYLSYLGKCCPVLPVLPLLQGFSMLKVFFSKAVRLK